MPCSNALHLRGDELQCLVPGDFLERLASIDSDSHQRLLQPVRVEISTWTTGSARTKTAAAVQVILIAGDLPELTVFLVDISCTFPEAHVADRGCLGDNARSGQGAAGATAQHQSWRYDSPAANQRRDLDEFAPPHGAAPLMPAFGTM
jgi:hypothetical protein